MFKHFNDKLKLKKLMVLLVIDINNNTTEFNIKNQSQNRKIEILISKKVSIIFKLLFTNIILILTDSEILFDNSVY